jgi:tetratricopeptide (TPR) repeat protein
VTIPAVLALAVRIASATVCPSAPPIVLPPLSPATQAQVQSVRALIDASRVADARTRWETLAGWSPASGVKAYGRADAAFSAHDYRRAFSLYDRILFCGPVSELGPAAEDSGAAGLIDRALRQAADGDLAAARRLLRTAAERDAASIESRYFLGLVEFAQRDRRAAREAWKAAIDADGYTQPPDGWALPRAQQAAIERYISTR